MLLTITCSLIAVLLLNIGPYAESTSVAIGDRPRRFTDNTAEARLLRTLFENGTLTGSERPAAVRLKYPGFSKYSARFLAKSSENLREASKKVSLIDSQELFIQNLFRKRIIYRWNNQSNNGQSVL